MPTSIKCPECQKSLKVNESLAGKRVRCPACQRRFVVPGAVDELEEVDPSSLASEAETDSSVQATRPARRPRPQPDEEDEEDERPARRSRREPEEDEDDDDEEERPRRPRRRRRGRPAAPSSNAPLVLGILSLVFCCIPIVGVILGVLARNKADAELDSLPGSSRYDGARRKQEVAKILGTVGLALSILMFVLNIVMFIMNKGAGP